MTSPPSITDLLSHAGAGDPNATASLLPLVYNELRRLAASYLAREHENRTLQPTALVHEAYLRLAGNPRSFRGQAHFLAAAAVAMRRVLVDSARRKATAKRRGDLLRVPLASDPAGVSGRELNALELDELLERLRALDGRKSRVVEMHIFGGMTFEQIAEVLGISRSVAGEDWAVARAWLAAEMRRN